MTAQETKIKIIASILEKFKTRFRVFDNTAGDKRVVAEQFPDIIFLQPEPPPNNNILFVMKIETGENLLDSVAEWKGLGNIPSVLYIVVPASKLDEAKKLANAAGVRAKFAWYELSGENLKQIQYE